jgi:hypothetical protein
MASDYGLNFGFRRSDESVRVSEGRVKTPATGPLLMLGTAVELDPANAGYLKAAATGKGMRPGTCGLLVQEEDWDRTIYQSELVDSFGLGVAKPNRLSVITTGAGTKVWFKNTAGSTRADGRIIPAVTMVTLTSVAVGRGLAWNGTTWVDVADPTAATSFMEVTYLDSAKGYVEAVFVR